MIVDAYGNYIIRDIYIYSPTTDYLEYAAHVLNNNLCVFDDNNVLKYSHNVSGIRHYHYLHIYLIYLYADLFK